jgi:flagellum-specific peptidoglycan hydrolase FlgJ
MQVTLLLWSLCRKVVEVGAKNPRYQPCFQCLKAEAFAQALAKAGYATDPGYADKVINLMNQHKLQALDGGTP